MQPDLDGIPEADADALRAASRPTRHTVFMRTFLPWQLWRFLRINMKMMGTIRRSHAGRNMPPGAC